MFPQAMCVPKARRFLELEHSQRLTAQRVRPTICHDKAASLRPVAGGGGRAIFLPGRRSRSMLPRRPFDPPPMAWVAMEPLLGGGVVAPPGWPLPWTGTKAGSQMSPSSWPWRQLWPQAAEGPLQSPSIQGGVLQPTSDLHKAAPAAAQCRSTNLHEAVECCSTPILSA